MASHTFVTPPHWPPPLPHLSVHQGGDCAAPMSETPLHMEVPLKVRMMEVTWLNPQEDHASGGEATSSGAHSQRVRAGRPDSQAEPSLKVGEAGAYLCCGCLLGCLSLSLLVQLDKITRLPSSPPSFPLKPAQAKALLWRRLMPAGEAVWPWDCNLGTSHPRVVGAPCCPE